MIAKGLEDSSIPLEMLVTTQNSKELHLCLNQQQQGGADPPSSESSTPRERERERGRERERCLSAIFLCSSAQPVRPGGLAGIATPKGFLTREGAVSGWLAVVGGGDNRLIGREDRVGGRGGVVP